MRLPDKGVSPVEQISKAKRNRCHNTHPVFGRAGDMLPAGHPRHFGTVKSKQR